MKKYRRILSACLAVLLAAAICTEPMTALAAGKTPKTPNEAVAEMTWGVNLADLYMADEERTNGSTTGYVDFDSIAEFGMAMWFWDSSFEWLTYYDGYKGTFTVSAPVPYFYSASGQTGDLFRIGIASKGDPQQSVDITLSDTKLVKSDGTEILLSSMDKTYTGKTSQGPDINGWCWYFIDIASEAPEESSELNGANFYTTVTVGEGSLTVTSKSDYFFQYQRIEMDQEEQTDLFLDKGVNVFRLPVSWTAFVNDTTFEIDEEWLEAVQTEVDYILSQDAYCILNMHNDYLHMSFVGESDGSGGWTNLHWERDWMEDQYDEYVNARFAAVWEQIAEYFKDYGDKLILEPFNEPTMEWHDGVGNTTNWRNEQAERINEMNSLFVETVRDTGGNNATRLLCLPTANYCGYDFLSALELPEDDYLMVQLHSYHEMEDNYIFPSYDDYYDYEAAIDTMFEAVAAFKATNPNVPIIVGEVGVTHIRDDATQAPKVAYFFGKARENGVPCLWWEDCFYRDDGLQYWLYDKKAGEWNRPEVLNAILENSVQVVLSAPVLSVSADAATGKPVLTWNTVDGAAKYEIWRSGRADSGYQKIATVTEAGYIDEKATSGITYYYKVKAANGPLVSELSNECSITVALVDGAPKTAAQMVSEMVWGVNLAELYMPDETQENGSTRGYHDFPTTTQPNFLLAVWLWDLDYIELAPEYISTENGVGHFRVELPLKDYASGGPDYSIFNFRVMTRDSAFAGKTLPVTFSNSKFTLRDGTEITAPGLDMTHGLAGWDTMTTVPNDYGWYDYPIYLPTHGGDGTELNPGSQWDGATFSADMYLSEDYFSTVSKVDHYFQYQRYEMDQEEQTDLFLDEGVNVIRLPVSWTAFVNDTTFEIDKEWLEAVQTEVDYILSKNAYCILNMHNDYLNHSFVGVPDGSGGWTDLHWERDWMNAQYKAYVDARFAAVWEQIAEYFADYGDKLIFEPFNEPTMEWHSGVANTTQWYNAQADRINELNRLFVETVRATGGKNRTRVLSLVTANYCGYDFLSALELPEDDGYLMVQIHSYHEMEDNYIFPSYNDYYDYETEIGKLISAVEEFQAANPGVPVIIGEVGVSHIRDDATQAEKVAYFVKAAHEIGVPCLWWEDYFVVSENTHYWLYDKAAQDWGRPQILSTIQECVGFEKPEINRISVNSTTHKTAYKVGDALDVTDLTILVDMSHGEDPIINVKETMVTGFDSSVAAKTQTLTITYKGKTTTYTVSIEKEASLTAPTLTVSKNTSGKPYLSWTAVSGATRYEVYSSTDGKTFTKLIATTGKTVTHSSAKAGTTYYYKVRAITDTLQGEFSAVKSVSVAASFAAPTLTVSKNSAGKPYLSWTAADGATKYEVYSSTDGTNFSKLIATTGKTVTHSSAKAGTTYYYKVRAITDTTNGAFSAVKSMSVAASLAAPTLTVSTNTSGKPYLSWTAVTGATKYEVYSSTDGTNFSKLIATTGKTVTHSSAKAGTTYYYKVRAITDTLQGEFSAVKSVSVAASLTAPTLTVSKNSAGKPYLTWTGVTGATKYEVYYSTNGTSFTKLIATTGRTLTHSSAKAGTTYYYKVRAINATTNGAFSAVKSVSVVASLTAPTLTVTKNSAGKPYLTWTGVTGATKYEVYSSTDGKTFTKLIATTGKVLTHTSAKAGTTYYYKVRAINATTNGAFSTVKSAAANLSAPTLTVTKNSSGKPYLSWTAVSGATKYEVYFSADGETFTKLIATTGKVLTHSSAKAGATYYYKVRAINDTVTGAFSAVKRMSVN